MFETETPLDAAAALVAPAPRRGTVLRVGFIPLVDCAPLVVAHEKGFAAAEGLGLDLVRETSWANIRDRVVLGHFDAAHMLAPMTIAATLGIGHLKAPMLTPFVLNLGGNAVAVSTGLADAMAAADGAVTAADGLDDPAAAGRAVARAAAARAARGEPPLTLAMVYPFSSHNYELRYWLAAAGLDPDRDLRLIVVPPPFMVDALSAGQVDGFTVGAPWPSLAVDAGLGRIVATKAAIWPASPEKVVGLREAWAERHPEELAALVRALDRAAAWCAAPGHAEELAEILARPGYLGVAARLIARSLTGAIVAEPGAAPVPVADYLRFHGDGANRPGLGHGLWFASQMLRWRQCADVEAAFAAARRAFRSDLYEAALGLAPRPGPEPGFALFDGVPFDPADPAGYLDRLGAASGPGPDLGD